MSNLSNKHAKFIPMYNGCLWFTHLIKDGMLWKHLFLFLTESRILARIMQKPKFVFGKLYFDLK